MSDLNDNKTAKTDKSPSKRIVFVAFDGAEPLDITGPISVFARANKLVPDSYETILASPNGQEITCDYGIVLGKTFVFSELELPIDTIMISGGSEVGLMTAVYNTDLIDHLKHLAPNIRRMGSVCTGAFILAATGLLNNRRVVTHWASCALLQKICPEVTVNEDAIFIYEDGIFTSAGVTAGIDAALALVEEDLGAAIAAQIAKSMVMFLRRPGGQSQYSQLLSAQTKATSRFADLIHWISKNLSRNLSVSVLAQKAGMSERNFSRNFKTETNKTPALFIRTLRLETAQLWLETTQLPIQQIALDTGFGSIDSLERAVTKQFGTTPSSLRKTYGSNA
jgi:transcriptional regulator GlxA family with amidase domain